MPHNSDCGVYKVEVVGGDRAVACGNCDDWYHTASIYIGKALYKGLDSPNVFWICNKCLDIVNEILHRNREVQKVSLSDTAIGEPRNDAKNNSDIIQSENNNNELEIMVSKNKTGSP